MARLCSCSRERCINCPSEEFLIHRMGGHILLGCSRDFQHGKIPKIWDKRLMMQLQHGGWHVTAGGMTYRCAHLSAVWSVFILRPAINYHSGVSHTGRVINVCAILYMDVQPDALSALFSWWKLKIPWCSSRRLGEIVTSLWTSYKFLLSPTGGTHQQNSHASSVNDPTHSHVLHTKEVDLHSDIVNVFPIT